MDISKVRKKLQSQQREKDKKNKKKKTISADREDTGTSTAMTEAVQDSIPERTEGPPGAVMSEPADVPTEEAPLSDENIELIAFTVANEEFAIRLLEMQEIMRFQVIVPVPRSPRYLQGVTFLRGKVLPIINLEERFSHKREWREAENYSYAYRKGACWNTCQQNY